MTGVRNVADAARRFVFHGLVPRMDVIMNGPTRVFAFASFACSLTAQSSAPSILVGHLQLREGGKVSSDHEGDTFETDKHPEKLIQFFRLLQQQRTPGNAQARLMQRAPLTPRKLRPCLVIQLFQQLGNHPEKQADSQLRPGYE